MKKEDAAVYVKAGYRLLGLETRDDAAAEAVIASALPKPDAKVARYNPATKVADDTGFGLEPASRLAAFLDTASSADVLVLRDVSGELALPAVSARLKDLALAADGKSGPRLVFVVGRAVVFPDELAELSRVLPVSLPGSEEVGRLVDAFARAASVPFGGTERREVVRALQGVPACTVPRLLGAVHARTGSVSARDVLTEKTAALGGHGLLELVDVAGVDCAMGGMLVLRGYLEHVSHLFAHAEDAREFGVDVPKGLLVAGMPGCGKSLSAKVAAKLFGVPLLRLDTGRLMGKYNGDSERNLREALRTAEAQAPCVLWIDEVEKAFAGVGRDADNGVATRLFGSFLTWLNDRTAPVYAIATANDIRGLPPELMRRGRFDELFFVDFPGPVEAEEILRAHIGRRGHALPDAELARLAKAATARGFSGADLEGVVKTAVELAFERRLEARAACRAGWRDVRVSPADFREALKMAKSTRESMGSKVVELRRRLAEFRLTPASEGRSAHAARAKGGAR